MRRFINPSILVAVIVAVMRSSLHAEFIADPMASDLPDAAIGDGFCLTESFECSLRAAIQEANSSSNGEVIVPYGRYRLSSQLTVDGAVSAIGVADLRGRLPRIEARRRDKHRLFDVIGELDASNLELKGGGGHLNGGLIHVRQGAYFHGERLLIQRGSALSGGCLYVGEGGSASLHDTSFIRCIAEPDVAGGTQGCGGNIYVGGDFTCESCWLYRGQGRSTRSLNDICGGGGIYVSSTGNATLSNVSIEKCRARLGTGGCALNDGGQLTLLSSAAINCQANSGSGGIVTRDGGITTISGCVVSGSYSSDHKKRDAYNCHGPIDAQLGNVDSGFACNASVSGARVAQVSAKQPTMTSRVIVPRVGSAAINSYAPPCATQFDAVGKERPLGDLCDAGPSEQ